MDNEQKADGPKRDRLQKYVANCGYSSRRKAELLIQHGLVRVNGKIVDELGVKIRPGKDVVTIVGEEISPPEPTTIVLNKPAGFITSTHDTHERLTVMDLLPRPLRDKGVLPAGRLDLETEGLLVMTNVGDLMHQITHPRYECSKEYVAVLGRRPKPAELDKLRAGVYLPDLDKETQPADIEILEGHAVNGEVPVPPRCVARVTIGEGMKRQVRRTFEVVGIKVMYLERRRVGEVTLGDLERGEWRELTETEIGSLVADS